MEPGSSRPGGTLLQESWDHTAETLLDLAGAVIKKKSRADRLARKAFTELAGSLRYDFAERLIKEWDLERRLGPAALSVINAAIDLLAGRYGDAARQYTRYLSREMGMNKTADPEGLISDLDPEERRSLAVRLGGEGEVRFFEDFEKTMDRWETRSWEGGGEVGLDSDPTGKFGGRYERGRYAFLSGETTEIIKPSNSELAAFTSHETIRIGEKPFKLSFLVYIKQLNYSQSLIAVLFREKAGEKIRTIPKNLEDSLLVTMGHNRNTTFVEGDRYGFGTHPGKWALPGEVIHNSELTSFFPVGHWLEVEFEYIPELGVNQSELRHVDRKREDAVLAGIDYSVEGRPKPGFYKLYFGLLHGSSEPAQVSAFRSEIFIDEIRLTEF